MFAIIRVGNSQYKVAAKDVILVDSLKGEVGETITISDVLLLSDEKKTIVGTPLVSKASVTAKIIAHEKGEKISVRRYKSKVRYRRQTGFRARLTRLEIERVTMA